VHDKRHGLGIRITRLLWLLHAVAAAAAAVDAAAAFDAKSARQLPLSVTRRLGRDTLRAALLLLVQCETHP